MRNVPLRRLLRPRDEANRPDLQVLSVYRDYGVIPKASRSDNFNKTPEDVSRYLHVAVGDLVVNKMKAWSGSVAVSGHEGIVSGDYLVCSVSPEIQSRFLHYLLRSPQMVSQMRLRSRGIRTNQERLYWEDLAEIQVDLPSRDEQRQIADFLDDRVARIDNIIAARRTQIDRFPELELSEAGSLLSSVEERGAGPLGALAEVIDTEHKTAPTVPGGGHWIAGTSALRRGRLDHQALRETDEASYGEWTARGAPGLGDVLLSREAPVGEVALLESVDPKVAIGQRVVMIRARSTDLVPGYIRLVLMSPVLQRIVAEESQGSLHPHLNMADITSLRIPVATEQEQKRLAKEHARLLAEMTTRRSTMERSIALLTEYKQSMITSAVSGEIDVPAASREVPV